MCDQTLKYKASNSWNLLFVICSGSRKQVEENGEVEVCGEKETREWEEPRRNDILEREEVKKVGQGFRVK